MVEVEKQLREGEAEMELVDKLMVFIICRCAVRGNKEGTILEKLQEANFYHEQWISLKIPFGHFSVEAARQKCKESPRGGW